DVVAGARGREVGLDLEVHLEGLGPVLLLGQEPAEAEDPQAPELDEVRVGHGQVDAPRRSRSSSARVTRPRPVGPIWRSTIRWTTEMVWGPLSRRPAQRT